MKLIRKLGRKLVNKSLISCGIFECLDCKQEVEKALSNGLRAKSCGCVQYKEIDHNNIKHGGSYTKLYSVWANIKDRCLNIKNHAFKDYGGRGITICNEWLEFIPFRDWSLSNGYADNLQINRIKNEGNYEPSNCNFITGKENCRSRRGQKVKNMEMANEIRYLYKTGKYTRKELAIKFGVSQTTISDIINNKRWKN